MLYPFCLIYHTLWRMNFKSTFYWACQSNRWVCVNMIMMSEKLGSNALSTSADRKLFSGTPCRIINFWAVQSWYLGSPDSHIQHQEISFKLLSLHLPFIDWNSPQPVRANSSDTVSEVIIFEVLGTQHMLLYVCLKFCRLNISPCVRYCVTLWIPLVVWVLWPWVLYTTGCPKLLISWIMNKKPWKQP